MIQKIKNIFDGFSCKKKSFFVFLSIIACLVFGIAIFGKPVFASTADLVSQIFVFAGGFLMNLLSTLLLGMTDILVGVISYNSFLDATVVVKGWILVRDICNMFFIFILIYNAFLMVLGIESQGDPKRNILKVLLAAILINFSRLICGIIIDFSQVIMLSFVNAFKDAIANNLLSALAVQDLLHINRERMLIESGWGELAGAMVLALIMVTISTLIVLALLLTLIVRVVVLWLSIILSPLAFVVGLVPFGKSFANEWWQNFTKNVISGPVLAFFLWLVFSLINSQPNLGQEIIENEATVDTLGEAAGSTVSIAITEVGSAESLSSFLVAVILLIMSIGMAKKFGATGTGTILNAFSKTGKAIKKGVTKVGKSGAKFGGYWYGRSALYAGSEFAKELKMPGVSKFMSDWNKNLGKRRLKERTKKVQKTLGKFGFSEDNYQQIYEMMTKPDPANPKKRIIPGGIVGEQIFKPVTEASKKEASKIRRISRFEEAVKNDPNFLGGVSSTSFYDNANGLSSEMKKKLEKINGNNQAAQNFANYIDDTSNNTKNDKRVFEQLAKAIKAMENDGVAMNELLIVSTALENRANTDGNPKYNPSSHSQAFVADRNTGLGELTETRGKFSTSSNFSNGKDNELSIDFRDIESAVSSIKPDFDVKQEGINIKGQEARNVVVPEIVNKINQRESELDMDFQEGKISLQAYDIKKEKLQKTRDRLENLKETDDLQLINSGVRSSEQKSSRKTYVHEKLHGAGLKDEDMTEELTQEIVSTKAYGLSEDIGRIASKRESEGQSLNFGSIINDLKVELNNKLQGVDDSGEKELIEKKLNKLDGITSENNVDKIVAREEDIQEVASEKSGEGLAGPGEGSILDKLEEIREEIQNADVNESIGNLVSTQEENSEQLKEISEKTSKVSEEIKKQKKQREEETQKINFFEE